jgi:hypothetical protein
LRIPGFAAEASLSKARAQYRHSESTIPAAGPMVLPQQIVIPPGLRCWLNYQACNNSCANWPIWPRDICHSYCFAIYNRCLRPV